jgi:hypothetical protein
MFPAGTKPVGVAGTGVAAVPGMRLGIVAAVVSFVLMPGVSPVRREVLRPESPACGEWRRACLTPWARLGNRNDPQADDVRRRVSEACATIFPRASVSCTAWPSTLDLRRMPIATATR